MSTSSRRSAAGKKGAAARWGKGQDDENDNDQSLDEDMDFSDDNSNQGNNKSSGGRGRGRGRNLSHEEAAEMGRKGGKARRGNSSQSRNEDDDDDGDDNSLQQRGSKGGRGNRGVPRDGEPHKPLSRVGDEEADTMEDDDLNEDTMTSQSRRKIHSDLGPGKNPNRVSVGKRVAAETPYEELQERGRKGGAGNKGIHASGGYDDDYSDMESYLDNPEMGVPAKNPSRVQAGKKAAQSRSHEDLAEQGRKGGQARRGQANFGGGYVGYEEGFEDFGSRDDKNMNRVRGGQRAASKRSPEEFSKLGKMGAQARWGKNSGRNENSEDEEASDDNSSSGNKGGRGRGRNLSHEEAVELGRKGAESRWGYSKSSNGGGSNQNSPNRHKRHLNEDYGEKDENGDYDRRVRHEGRGQGRILY
jgi:hypothetical protein